MWKLKKTRRAVHYLFCFSPQLTPKSSFLSLSNSSLSVPCRLLHVIVLAYLFHLLPSVNAHPCVPNSVTEVTFLTISIKSQSPLPACKLFNICFSYPVPLSAVISCLYIRAWHSLFLCVLPRSRKQQYLSHKQHHLQQTVCCNCIL